MFGDRGPDQFQRRLQFTKQRAVSYFQYQRSLIIPLCRISHLGECRAGNRRPIFTQFAQPTCFNRFKFGHYHLDASAERHRRRSMSRDLDGGEFVAIPIAQQVQSFAALFLELAIDSRYAHQVLISKPNMYTGSSNVCSNTLPMPMPPRSV